MGKTFIVIIDFVFVFKQLTLAENAKKELIEDQATKKPRDVFIYCFLLLLILVFLCVFVARYYILSP